MKLGKGQKEKEERRGSGMSTEKEMFKTTKLKT